MPKQDFQFLDEVLKRFFSQSKIIAYFNHFCEQEITDFEPWLQIELAIYLSKMKNTPEWWREQYIPFHKSKSRDVRAEGMKVDFQIRPYKNKRDSFIFLEIKQKQSTQECITSMVSDLNKLYKGKGTEINNARSFWALGVHKRDSKKEIKRKVIETAEEWLEEKLFTTKVIPKTEYSYTLF